MVYARTIREQIFSIEEGKLFVSRDFSSIAPRNVIDRTLHRLTRRGVILRITRGIYMRETADMWRPTVEDVAQAKARAFKKDIQFQKAEIHEKVSEDTQAESRHIFLCSGPTTSFQYGNTRIKFRSVTPRKLRLLSNIQRDA